MVNNDLEQRDAQGSGSQHEGANEHRLPLHGTDTRQLPLQVENLRQQVALCHIEIDELRAELTERNVALDAARKRSQDSQAALDAILRSRTWQCAVRIRKIIRLTFRGAGVTRRVIKAVVIPSRGMVRRIRGRSSLRHATQIVIASGLFDDRWYLSEYPDVAASGVDPLRDYLTVGARNGRDPNPLFNSAWYVTQYPDVRRLGANPLAHYVEFGAIEGRDPNPVFDSDWYLRQIGNPINVNPLRHYIQHGISEGRAPHPAFDTTWYTQHYQDVAASGVPPLQHYLQYGLAEGRSTFDPEISLADVKIAVVVHVFYDELWREIVPWLQNIPIAFDLYVTLPRGKAATLRPLVLSTHPTSTVLEVENQGRDIGPFIRALPHLVDKDYTAICKLHTKKGGTQPETWRFLMLRGLLANPLLITSILNAFKTESDLLLVGPHDLYLSGPVFSTETNSRLDEVADRMYPGIPAPKDWGFFAGTMFWIGPQLLRKFAEAFCDDIWFERDNSSNDGQTAHALERLFGLATSIERGRIGLTSVREQGPWGSTLTTESAPGKVVREPLGPRLNARAAELRDQLPLTPAPTLRRWMVPRGIRPGVNFIGPVEFLNGVSISARGYASGLMQADIGLNVIPWRPGFDRLQRIDNVQYPSRGLQSINLIHLNLDLLSTARLLDLPPLAEIASSKRYNIAIIYWELTALADEWHAVMHRFDEIWCASSFIARSVSAVCARPVRVVRPLLSHLASVKKYDRSYFGLPTDRFIFFYAADAGSILGRKNPKGFIDAYIQEFSPDEGTCCLVKIHYSDPNNPEIRELLSVAEKRKDVIFIRRLFDDDEMNDLFQAIDCYVSPHRSEGLGLTILEAMNAGKPVIATPYGGVSDFVTQETAFLIEYRLSEVGDGNAPYPPHFVWAEPFLDSIRANMRTVFSNPAQASTIAAAGQAFSTQLFSADRVVPILQKEIDRIWQTPAPNTR